MQYPEHNVLCLVNSNDIVVAAILWNDRGKVRNYGHVAVLSEYRHKGLGSIIMRYSIYDAIKKDMKVFKSWVAEDNVASLAMHRKLGFIKNGMISYQYLFER